MGACNREEIDRIVERCKWAVEKYGGQSAELVRVRVYYKMFCDCPEHGAMVALEAELEKVGF